MSLSTMYLDMILGSFGATSAFFFCYTFAQTDRHLYLMTSTATMISLSTVYSDMPFGSFGATSAFLVMSFSQMTSTGTNRSHSVKNISSLTTLLLTLGNIQHFSFFLFLKLKTWIKINLFYLSANNTKCMNINFSSGKFGKSFTI